MARAYDMDGRRLLAVLREGGERKHGILRAIIGSEERLQAVLRRFRRSIKSKRRQGGIHYALAKPRKA